MLIPYTNRMRNVSVFDPFRAMDEFEKAFFSDTPSNRAAFSTDIKEEDDSFILEADLPGVKKEDIKLELSDNILSITAVRHSEYEEKDKKSSYVRCERSYGSYKRSFDVSGIDRDLIEAEFTDGVLKLTLPKVKEVKPETKTLEIK